MKRRTLAASKPRPCPGRAWLSLCWLMVCLGPVARGHAIETSEVSLTNPSFELGLEGWRVWYARQKVTVSTPAGEGGRHLRLLGEEGSRVVVSQAFVARAQQWYEVRYRYRAIPNGDGGGCMGYCRLSFADPNGKFIDYPGTKPLPDTFGAWQVGRQTVKTPLSIGKVTIGFNSSGAADLRIDDVTVQPIDPPVRPPNTWSQLVEARKRSLTFSSWQYNSDAGHFRRMGLKYGWRYGYDEQFDQLVESHTVGLWRGAGVYRRYAQRGIRACVYLYSAAQGYWKAHYDGEPPADVPYILDPVWHSGLVESCREACRSLGVAPGIEYIFAQDESYGRYKSALLPIDQRQSAFWADLDAEIRDQFGGGTYGLPEGPDDTNPYRWIAYYRWVGEQWAGTFDRLRQVIDRSGCGAKLLGPDEVGILMPLPWGRLARSVDVFTGQCLYSRGAARTYIAGFTTKYSHDLTGKPVHNATQIVKYSGSPPPEEVQRQYSQVVQNGGEGQMLIGVEWFDRELSHHQYSAPARWATIKNLLRLMANYRVKTPGASRLALLYSSPSGMSQGPRFNSDHMLTAYALCGPKAGAWPTIIDTSALAEGEASLFSCTVAVLPWAPYETPKAFRHLQSFAKAGGLLVCCDPGALRKDTLGGDLPVEGLLGVRASEGPRHRQMQMAWPQASRQRVYSSECLVLEPASARTSVIGTYDDGSAAVTLHRVGKGAVAVFGANPLASTYVSEDEQWQQWWRSVLASRDVRMDLPIWKLRLPDSALVQARAPEDVCLTGNNFVRCQNGVYLGANQRVEGYYTLSVPPDLLRESAGAGRIDFDKGDLTDRVEATKGPFDSRGVAKEPYEASQWANRWSAEALSSGLTVDFILPEARELSRVRFWYSGYLPHLTVEGLREGVWQVLAAARPRDVGADVEEMELPVAGLCSGLRLRFGPGGGSLTLADIELWSQPE